ncbi:MAG: IPT/TIG domain-containing protein [Chloroherpetonaceae bacterium]|nr:IPT/TIG domain-containing protein [Chloroherpetonaceae bacterium]MDW8437805.1 IPT/TIG domain-containing protein [Chloroherpetonaceae bacterium]
MRRLLGFLLVGAIVVAIGACGEDSTSPSTDVTVTGVNPTSASVGDVVTITGTNFGSDKAALTVRFGNASATIDTIIGGTQLRVRVPENAPIGQTTIAVTKAGKTASVQFTVNDPIVGNWRAEGFTTITTPTGSVQVPNVSPLLFGAPFRIRRIDATFNANGTYRVVTVDSAGTSSTLTGTWTTSAADTVGITIRNITVNQSSPTSVTSQGIYQVSVSGGATRMLYEIAQVQPPLQGVTPPTPRGGFGSTSNGAFGIANIQRYVKQ